MKKYLLDIPNKKLGWNFLSGISSGILIVSVTPWYIKCLGFDAYGIIGILLMLQAIVVFFDLGMGALVTRIFSDGEETQFNKIEKKKIFFTADILCLLGAGIIFLIIFLSSNFVADKWLRSNTLSFETISYSLILIGVALALQFIGNLYINVLLGMQNHRVLSLFQVYGNLMRYLGGALVLVWIPSLLSFLAVQVCASAIQTVSLRIYVWRKIFGQDISNPKFSLRSVLSLRKYSFWMSATAIVSALLANSDRLILSRMVSLSDLGRYSIALTAASVVSMFILPFYRVFLPKFSELFFLGDIKVLYKTYLLGCEVLSIFLISVIFYGIFCAPELFNLWIGNSDESVILAFQCLIFGIGLSGLVWLPASLLQAFEQPRIHFLMMSLGLVLGVPFAIVAINFFGYPGASLIWIIHGIIGISIEVWIIQKYFIKTRAIDWYARALILPTITCLLLQLTTYYLIRGLFTDLYFLFFMGISSLIAVIIGLMFLNFIKDN